MALINYTSKEITLKIVYYGPGLSGKTTNLQYLHSRIAPDRKGKLLSLATETDRTLFFDFMPVTLGKVGDFTVKFQLYTVPGQVRYNATRKLVLKGADAVVFIADSQTALREQNMESYENMIENLEGNNLDPNDIPIVIQYNKRDLDDVMSINTLNRDVNPAGHKTVSAEAVNGKGVDETFQLVTKLLVSQIARKHRIGLALPEAEKAATPAAPKRSSRQVAPQKPAAAPQPPPPPPIREQIHEEAIPPVPGMETPKMPALSEMSEYPNAEKILSESDVTIDMELPQMDDFSNRKETPPPVPPRSSSKPAPPASTSVSTDGLGQAISGIRSSLENISRSADAAQRAVTELAAELKHSRKNQEKIIDLLKKIEGSISSGSSSKR